MASRKIDDCHVILKRAWVLAEKEWDERYPDKAKPFLTCTYRSNVEQNLLFSNGRGNDRVKVTNARGGESPHNFIPSLAFDIGFIRVDKKLDWNAELFMDFYRIISVIEPLVEWGGSWIRFRDMPHFQLCNWKMYLKEVSN